MKKILLLEDTDSDKGFEFATADIAGVILGHDLVRVVKNRDAATGNVMTSNQFAIMAISNHFYQSTDTSATNTMMLIKQ